MSSDSDEPSTSGISSVSNSDLQPSSDNISFADTSPPCKKRKGNVDDQTIGVSSISSNYNNSVVGATTVYQTNNQQNHYYGERGESSTKHNDSTTCSSIDVIEKKLDDIKKKLKDKATQRLAVVSFFDLECSLTPVSLEMTSDIPRSLDIKGHYNKRKEFIDIMKQCKEKLSIEELFEVANNRAEAKIKREESKGSRLAYIELYGNAVGVIGQAGIGKTTLTQIMLRHILDGEACPNTEYIFYIPFRNIIYDIEIALNMFVMTDCVCDVSVNSHDIFKALEENEKVVFIFDGLDEAPEDAFSLPSNFEISKAYKPGVFIAMILCGNLFPKAKKLITSRPRQFYALHGSLRPKFVVEILGLDEQSQQELGKQICEPWFDDVMTSLKNHPDILACCYVPVNCIISVSILRKILEKNGKITAISLTGVFVEAFSMFVTSDHLREQAKRRRGERNMPGEIRKLCLLAWNGFIHLKFLFNEKDYRKVDIEDEIFQAFLVTHITLGANIKQFILEGFKISSFSHLVWQELLAAIYVAMFLSAVEFETYIMVLLSDARWEVVSKFLFGFCNCSLQSRLEAIFFVEEFEDWNTKKNMLYKLVVASLKDSSKLKSEQILLLCTWIQEAQNVELNNFVAEHLPDNLTISGSFLTTDAHNLAYVLTQAKKPLSLQLSRANFLQESFAKLTEGLSTLSTKMNELVLSGNKLGDEWMSSLSNVLHVFDSFKLRDCGITDVGAKVLAEKLSSREHPMKELDLGFNEIGDKGIASIVGGFHGVETLKLEKCGIGEDGCKSIASSLSLLSLPMKELKLNENKIGDEGISSLSDVLHLLDSSMLSDCGITYVGAKVLAEKLSSLEHPMKELDLGFNEIGDKGIASIVGGFHGVEKLKLKKCGIGEKGCKSIASSLSSLSLPMTELVLRNNNLGDEGAILLAQSIQGVGVLDVEKCNITVKGAKEMGRCLADLPNKKPSIRGLDSLVKRFEDPFSLTNNDPSF